MRFSIKLAKFQGLNQIELRDNRTKAIARIIPQIGSNLRVLKLFDGKEVIDVLVGDTKASELKQNKGHKAAFLIPFPNRTNDGKYSCAGKTYELPINFISQHHAIHGLIFNKKFKLEQKICDDYSAKVVTSHILKPTAGYPFKLKIQITHVLRESGYLCQINVENLSKLAAPVGIGWHPYFKLGDDDKNYSVNDWKLELPGGCKQIIVDNRQIPNKKIVNCRTVSTKIKSAHFDTGYKIKKSAQQKNDNFFRTSISNKRNKLTVWQDAHTFPYLQIYTPKDRKSVAIEPMSCAANAFNNKMGLKMLKYQEIITGDCGVIIKRNH